MIPNDDIRSPLVYLREKSGLTQEAFAKAIGVTDHTVRNWEKGRAEPKLTLRQFKKLCETLNIQAVGDLPDTFAPTGEGPH